MSDLLNTHSVCRRETANKWISRRVGLDVALDVGLGTEIQRKERQGKGPRGRGRPARGKAGGSRIPKRRAGGMGASGPDGAVPSQEKNTSGNRPFSPFPALAPVLPAPRRPPPRPPSASTCEIMEKPSIFRHLSPIRSPMTEQIKEKCSRKSGPASSGPLLERIKKQCIRIKLRFVRGLRYRSASWIQKIFKVWASVAAHVGLQLGKPLEGFAEALA